MGGAVKYDVYDLVQTVYGEWWTLVDGDRSPRTIGGELVYPGTRRGYTAWIPESKVVAKVRRGYPSSSTDLPTSRK